MMIEITFLNLLKFLSVLPHTIHGAVFVIIFLKRNNPSQAFLTITATT